MSKRQLWYDLSSTKERIEDVLWQGVKSASYPLPYILYQDCQHCVSKKSGNFAKYLTYALSQAIGRPRHRRSQLGGGAFSFLSKITNLFFKTESKFLNFRILLVVLWWDVQKSLGFQHIYKNSRNVCSITSITKSLRSWLKSESWQPCFAASACFP